MSPSAPTDFRVPRGPLAAAWQRGFDARLAGRSLFANDYADEMERRQAAGLRPGWASARVSAWWSGWYAADALVNPTRGR